MFAAFISFEADDEPNARELAEQAAQQLTDKGAAHLMIQWVDELKKEYGATL